MLWCYINDNWDAQRMWTEGGTFWGDSRVEAYADLALHWRRAVLASPTRLVSSEVGGGHYAGAALCGVVLVRAAVARATKNALWATVSG